MRKLLGILVLLAGLGLSPNTANAAIIMSVEPMVSFEEGSGARTLDLFVQATAGEILTSLTADLVLQTASFTVPPGTFGLAGFVGEGNLNPASSFERNVGDTKQAALSLDFNANQLFPATDTPIVRISFDISGLAPGNYSVTALDVTVAPDASGNAFAGTFIPGSFTITPSVIPEPSAIVLTGLALVGGAVGRRSFRKKTETV